jgi:RNA:NAD 2'-phosphotransferase (TPT1/KptA family)
MLALANAAGISANKAEADEVARVLAKPLEHFTKRNQVKNDAGFLAAKSVAGDAGAEQDKPSSHVSGVWLPW